MVRVVMGYSAAVFSALAGSSAQAAATQGQPSDPPSHSAAAAPASDRGRIVSTVMGCRNELNCEPSTM